MDSSQTECWEIAVVTSEDVEIARADRVRAHGKLSDAQRRLQETVERESQATRQLKNYERLRAARQFCDSYTTRTGASVVLGIACGCTMLLLCFSVGLPAYLTTIALVAALMVTALVRKTLLKPEDAELERLIVNLAFDIYLFTAQRNGAAKELRRAQASFNSAVLALEGVLREFQSRINRLRSTNWRELQGIPFEKFLAEVFLEWGYEARTTKASGDHGVDLVVSKHGRSVAIQAKGYVSSTVGNDAVQQAYSGRAIYGCHACAVITNSTFTAHAQDAAKRLGCLLIDGSQIPSLIDGRIPI